MCVCSRPLPTRNGPETFLLPCGIETVCTQSDIAYGVLGIQQFQPLGSVNTFQLFGWIQSPKGTWERVMCLCSRPCLRGMGLRPLRGVWCMGTQFVAFIRRIFRGFLPVFNNQCLGVTILHRRQHRRTTSAVRSGG